ncbi:MAG: V-type ATP synthase subunit F [Actinomycetota bacterium]
MRGEGVIVVVPPELDGGFRLAGVETAVATGASEARLVLDRLLEEGRGGVIAVYEPFLEDQDPGRRAGYEASLSPIVMPLPAGRGERDHESHRARISAMLSRAVGYHITFDGEAET